MLDILRLYATFFYLGIVNFGGGYAMLPLLERELVDKRKWCTVTDLTDYYAIGQCTPGAIAVNVSTFIGYKKKGVLGGIAATLGFVSPAFIIIFIIASLLTNFSDNTYVQNALAGINVCVFFLVIFAISKLVKKSITDIWTLILAVLVAALSIFVPVIPLFTYVIFAAIYGLVVSIIKEKKEQNKFAKLEVLDGDGETAEEANKVDEPKAEAKIEESPKNMNIKSDAIHFIAGLATGLILGVVGFVSFIFMKNKKFIVGFVAAFMFWLIMFACTMVAIFAHNTILFQLYFNFFRIGVCAFGGGLATIPFLYELGETTGWFTAVDVTNMIAVAESTPGAMGINMSTYVGYTVGLVNGGYGLAFLGSIISTIGLVSPSIIVIEIICLFLYKFKNNKYVTWVFYGLRAGSIGLIIRAAYSILIVSIFNMDIISAGQAVTATGFFNVIKDYFDILVNWRALGVGLIFGILIFKYKKHPVIYIAAAAVVGILLQMAI